MRSDEGRGRPQAPGGERESTARSDESNESCLWAYAITADHGGVEQYALSGVAGARVRAVGVAGLTVLVSDVSQAEFGERALRLNLENAEWLEDVARAHHQVIDAMAHMFPLLPLRLATVYSNDAAMTAALAGRGDELRDALRRIGGRVEWGVKAYAARQREGERHASTAGTGPGAGADGAGIAYLKRRRAELSAQEDSRRTAAASARAVHTELSGQAEQARLYPPQAPALSGSKVPMLLNATYLLGADGADRFASAVAATANAHPDLRLVLTGPWPPYSFAGDADLET